LNKAFIGKKHHIFIFIHLSIKVYQAVNSNYSVITHLSNRL